ncbi:MAG: LytR/AlgR family response regulator transcription factor [Terriglobales bacterium]
MTNLRALIVDDERLARAELRRLLAAHPDVTVVAESPDAADAELRLQALRPELVFLDVEMPGRNGLEMLEAALEAMDDPPWVILTTAFENYALRAFELDALDYLLKPIVPARLAQALQRARQRLAAPPAGAGERAAQPMHQVFVREGEQCWLVRLADIRLLQSEGNYTRVFFAAHRPLVPRSLAALEPRLDPALFFRANRGEIVALRWIAGIEPDLDGGYLLTLREGPSVKVSRRQARLLRERLSL